MLRGTLARAFTPLFALLLGACGDDVPAATGAGGGALVGGGGAGATGGGGSDRGAGGAPCVDSLPPDAEPPELLSQTGLYASPEDKTLASYVQPFEPQFQLWADGAVKQRYVYLPECGAVDTTDPDDWSLPVGTRLWKEFHVGDVLVETRLIERFGPKPHDFHFVAYVWNEDGGDAVRMPLGVADALGTGHDVPSEDACHRCHGSHAKGGGRPSRALGFSALQLALDGEGVTLATLADQRKLTRPIAAPLVPGDTVERAALGYLHANCGHCHNDTKDGVPQVDLHLWLKPDQTSVETTSAFLTAVGVATEIFSDPHVTARIEPGEPATSAVIYRMSERGNNAQMPPAASEIADAEGIATVAAWIEALP